MLLFVDSVYYPITSTFLCKFWLSAGYRRCDGDLVSLAEFDHQDVQELLVLLYYLYQLQATSTVRYRCTTVVQHRTDISFILLQ